MSGNTPELSLKTAVDADDTADYLTLSLASSLTTLDALFNNTTGHSHSGAHQGGAIASIPAGAIADGSITSAKIADGAITTLDIAAHAITQAAMASGAVSSPTTTSGVNVDMPDMSVTLTTTGGDLLVWMVSAMLHSLTNAVAGIGLRMDSGGEVFGVPTPQPAVASGLTMVSTIGLFLAPSAGSHTIKGRWATNAGTMTAYGTNRTLIVLEVKK